MFVELIYYISYIQLVYFSINKSLNNDKFYIIILLNIERGIWLHPMIDSEGLSNNRAIIVIRPSTNSITTRYSRILGSFSI